MERDEATTAGTEGADDATPLEESGESGTPQPENRNAEHSAGESDDWKKLAISLQEKAAKVNELERRLQQLEGGDEDPPDARRPDAEGADPFEEWVEKKDPVAIRLKRLERRMELEGQLAEMPADERGEVRDHFVRNWRRLGDMKAARAEIRETKLDQENRELRDRLAKLERGPDPEVMNAPPTHGREITARQTKAKEWTEEQFDAEAERTRNTQGELAYLKFMANAPRTWRR